MAGEIKHYGMPRRSGRYPWGSGGDPYQSAIDFRGQYRLLKKQGKSDVEIAEGEGISTTDLRARVSMAKTEQRRRDQTEAVRLKDKGYSNMEIGRRMGKNESSIRSLLDPVLTERANITDNIAKTLKESVDKNRLIDVGTGVENYMGVRRPRLNNALAQLEAQGYKVHTVNVEQVGIPGQFTKVKVLGTPDTTWKEVVTDVGKIQPALPYSDDFGRTFNSDLGLKPVQHVALKRVQVRYAEEGGNQKDGVIELRRGVKDLDLGGSKYAQVRIGVNGTHYLKGMAIYSDEKMPPGVDIIFNTNKHNTGNKLDAMKKLKTKSDGEIDTDNPFGSTIKKNGQRGALNVVNEEGDWTKWSRTISSQVLSKQSPPVAKTQLELAYQQKKEEYEEISALTNPVVKRHLLMAFADDCDSSAVHLKAAALPRQASKVILPVPDLKETEVYAPTFKDGETVVLIRHPHGGTFEIPQLKVNNRSKPAKAIMENAIDAVGIHPKVAQKLSGADFDGDTVIVIPNSLGKIKTSASLKGLENFDPIELYRIPPGSKIPKITKKTKQVKMGEVSNLITDMTIKGASMDEIARAVRHSMVVIDSEKHNLDYRKSYEDHGISSLSAKYQNGKRGGASTLISKASSEQRVDVRTLNSKPDPITGKKVYTIKPESYTNKKGKVVTRKLKSTKMAETDDAHTLSSGRPIEKVYADHANSLKALANSARRQAMKTTPLPYSPSAAVAYKKEVSQLNDSLNIALKNKPLERHAQVMATSVIKRKLQESDNLEEDDEKKIRTQALSEARIRSGANKIPVHISDKQWEAIQAGAISPSRLTAIIKNTNIDYIKQLATPRTAITMTPTKVKRAQTLLDSGATIAEVADVLGVSASTITKALKT